MIRRVQLLAEAAGNPFGKRNQVSMGERPVVGHVLQGGQVDGAIWKLNNLNGLKKNCSSNVFKSINFVLGTITMLCNCSFVTSNIFMSVFFLYEKQVIEVLYFTTTSKLGEHSVKVFSVCHCDSNFKTAKQNKVNLTIFVTD